MATLTIFVCLTKATTFRWVFQRDVKWRLQSFSGIQIRPLRSVLCGIRWWLTNPDDQLLQPLRIPRRWYHTLSLCYIWAKISQLSFHQQEDQSNDSPPPLEEYSKRQGQRTPQEITNVEKEIEIVKVRPLGHHFHFSKEENIQENSRFRKVTKVEMWNLSKSQQVRPQSSSSQK